MVDEEPTKRCGVGRIVGQDGVHLALVVEPVRLEAARQEGTRRTQERWASRQGDEASIAHERVVKMDGGIAI